MDWHTQIIKDLKGEVKKLRLEQRDLAYKMEEQENRSRRKNLRIRGLQEPTDGEDLVEKMKKIFNTLLGREEAEPIGIEREEERMDTWTPGGVQTCLS